MRLASYPITWVFWNKQSFCLSFCPFLRGIGTLCQSGSYDINETLSIEGAYLREVVSQAVKRQGRSGLPEEM